jgi:hypothetical protein
MYVVLNSKDSFAKALIVLLILFLCFNTFFLIDMSVELMRATMKLKRMEGLLEKNIELNIQAKETNDSVLEAFGEEMDD